MRQSIYIPKKDDKTDRVLGEYINSRPEKQQLKIMFLRIAEGVYQYGTLRLRMRLGDPDILEVQKMSDKTEPE